MEDLPRYDELPRNETLGMGCAWGVFGESDQLGTINLLTEARVMAGIAEVTRGVVFNLALPLDVPMSERRTPYRHHVFALDRNTQDDVIDNLYLQGSSQWDALRHVRAREFGYYNGVPEDEAGPDGDQLGIDSWAEHGIVGRGIVLDVARHLETHHSVSIDPYEGYRISRELVEEVLDAQGCTIEVGDILMLRTGYAAALLANPHHVGPRSWPGLAPEEDMARFLWDRHVAAVVADNPAVEWAPGDPKEFLHRRLIPMLGMALGELFNLEALASDCAADRRYGCLFMAAPLNLRRGVGSPANAIAVK